MESHRSTSSALTAAPASSGVAAAERVAHLAHVVAGEAAPADTPAGLDHLLVQAVAVGPGDHEPGVGDHRRLVDVGHAGAHPAEADVAARRPDLRAQEPQRLGHEPVPEVGEHDVVGPGRHRVVEGQRELFTGEGVDQVGGGERPAPGQGGRLEHPGGEAGVGGADEGGRSQRGLAGELEGGLHHPLDGGGGEAELGDGGVELVPQPAHLLPQVALDAVQTAGGARERSSRGRRFTSAGRPSSRRSTSWASTGPTVPRSSRMVSTLRATSDRKPRSASRCRRRPAPSPRPRSGG